MTGLVIIAMLVSGLSAGGPVDSTEFLAGQDLQIKAPTMMACRQTEKPDEHVLLFDDGFSMSIGDNELSSRSAAVWLKAIGRGLPGMGDQAYYEVQVYLEKNVKIEQGNRYKTTPMDQLVIDGGDFLIVRYQVTGQVFASADKQQELSCEDLQKTPLFERAKEQASKIKEGPQLADTALVPGYPPRRSSAGIDGGMLTETEAAASPVAVEPAASKTEKKEPVFRYPVHVSAVWDPEPTIEKIKTHDGREAVTVSGRFYLWQRQGPDSLLEFQADSAVLFFPPGQLDMAQEKNGRDLAQGGLESAYLRGNIVMTEGRRTIRAGEIYYDFVHKQAVIVQAEMRFFDERRGLPIYLSADKLRQVSESLYQADQVRVTSSEFYIPQLSVNATRMVVMRDEQVQERSDAIDKAKAAAGTVQEDEASQWEGTMYDVNMKYYNTKLFGLPKMRSRFVRPDVPISRAAFGSDSTYGTSLETRWHLFRMLGLKEPAGMQTELAADYFSKRGVGGGVETEYDFDTAHGEGIAYIMNDHGEDDLGRADSRRNLEPDQDVRGRFGWRHMQDLSNDWRLTAEVGYVSDRNFLESMYRGEFYTDKGQETLIYLKQQRDNWAFTILGKTRINDFENMTEEQPTVEYHRKGESLWDHQLTWYSDSRISRLRDRYDEDYAQYNSGADHPVEKFYTFGTTRNELDWPVMLGTAKLTPFVAGTYAFEDQNGYDLATSGSYTGNSNNTALQGEGGVRGATMFWKEDPTVQSRLFDVDGIRHVVTPHFEAIAYEETEAGIKQRDIVNLGLSQRWQTHRGEGQQRRSVDLFRWNVDSSWLSHTADSADSDSVPNTYYLYGPYSNFGTGTTYGPAAFIYNDPSIPVFLRRDSRWYSMARDSINSDAEWRLSDTTAILGDLNYDTQSGVLQQFDAGVSRYLFPDISVYLGSRYLRPVIVDVPSEDVYEVGSHSVVGAITYQIGPRYWVSYSQEYNFDFGKGVRNDFGIIRQYHRMFYSLEVSFDQSLDQNAVMFSVWPEGVKELALGSRRYTGLVKAGTEQ